ncbi:GNAT family N-acetyltransferase [Flavobacterium adhaerens]|uniref:GNAT family N-acetyltransferase n=1 Tax=Flavobacterium adhaerens TaxID=3149043 RepID=UPI0032B42AD8
MDSEIDKVTIIPFKNELKDAIKILNLEWLQKHFKVEPIDELVLSNPQSEIIDKGGMIFYAQYQNQIVGTVSLMKIDNTTFELTKMAVTQESQGLGIGKKLMNHCITKAQEKEIQKLIIYSNRKLESAIILYANFGFKEIPIEKGVYERADIKMEKKLS